MNIPKPQNGQYSAINLVFNFAQVKFEKPVAIHLSFLLMTNGRRDCRCLKSGVRGLLKNVLNKIPGY